MASGSHAFSLNLVSTHLEFVVLVMNPFALHPVYPFPFLKSDAHILGPFHYLLWDTWKPPP